MSLIVHAAVVSIRTSQGVWSEYGGDSAKLDAAHATSLHLVRELRQCTSVTAISLPTDAQGTVSAIDSDGNTLVWALAGEDLSFGIGSATDRLSSGIDSLHFTGYQADGTATTVTDDVRSVEFVATVQLDRNVNATRTIRARVWLRAW
jgi:hypothetical protein